LILLKDGAAMCRGRHSTWRQNAKAEDEDGSET